MFDQPAEVNPSGAGLDLGDQAAVAGEAFSRMEAVDGTELAIDDDSRDFGWPGDGLYELLGGGDLDLGQDVCFRLIDIAWAASNL